MSEPDSTPATAACVICANTGTDYIGRPCRKCRPTVRRETVTVPLDRH